MLPKPMPLPPLPQLSASPLGYATERRPTKSPERLALWNLESSLQCSVIGTCLSDQDLRTAMRKHRVQLDPSAESYDIHGYCVGQSNHDCALARTLNKVLERKYTGAVRLMSRVTAPDDIRVLWERFRDSGQVAAGYWAVMSHSHIPATLKKRVFGEVHMLSHLHGRGAHELATRLSEAQHRCSDLEVRLRRSEASKRDALAERDAARARATDRAASAPLSHTFHAESPGCDRAVQRLEAKLAKCARALVATRVRARRAEAEVARLARASTRSYPYNTTTSRPAPQVATLRQTGSGLTKRRILYIGGRAAVVPHLRESAAARVGAFFHHDGGIEDSLHRIEEMIEGCDAVICPVDCVSHRACLMAKSICQRLHRRFLPIATSSRSGFERALEQLSTEPSASTNEG
jgi:hypothetical protein